MNGDKNMKHGLICCFFLAVIGQVFAGNKVGWEGSTSGDYIVYKDSSWKSEAYIGFLYYNETSIGTFLYIPESKLRVTVLFSCEDLDGELILTGQNITSPRSNDELYILGVNYLMEMLPSLYNKKIKPNTKSHVIKRAIKTFNTEQFGTSCAFSYASFVPLFALESIHDEKGQTMLSIEKMGRIKNGEDNIFFNFEPIKVKKADKVQTLALDSKAKKQTISVEGLKFTLDSQWTQIADNSFFMKDIAFLTVNRVQEKQFNSIPNDFASSVVQIFSMSRPETKLFFEENELKEMKTGFIFSTLQYDSQVNQKIRDINTVIKQEKEYVIVSLTVNDAYYKQHKKYFDALF